jgi:hypothetical protein
MRTDTAFKALAIVGFKDSQRRVEYFALGDDDDVEPCGDVVTTENLSYEPFRPVSLHGAAELFRGRDAQPTDRALIRQDEHRGEAAVHLGAAFVDFLELGAAADVFMRPEPRQMALFAADGQALAALRPTALEHQPPVFRAHPHQKPVRFGAVAVVWLERALTFHVFS